MQLGSKHHDDKIPAPRLSLEKILRGFPNWTLDTTNTIALGQGLQQKKREDPCQTHPAVTVAVWIGWADAHKMPYANMQHGLNDTDNASLYEYKVDLVWRV